MMYQHKSLLQLILDHVVVIGIMNSTNMFALRLPYFQFIKLLTLALIVWAYIPRLTKTSVSMSIVFGLIAARAQLGFTLGSGLSYMHAVVSTLLMVSIVLIPPEKKLRLLHVMKNFLAVIFGVGLVFHLLRLLGIFSEPSLFIHSASEGGRQWLVFPSQAYNVIRGSVNYTRFSSYFAEPGDVGIIATFVLALSNYRLTDRRNLIIFVSGIFSLSLTFFMLSSIYIGLQYVALSSLKESTIRAVFVLAILLLVIILFPFLQEQLGSRFELAEEGGGLQDQRANINAFREYWTLLGDLPFDKLLSGGAFQEAADLELTHVSWVQFVYKLGVIAGLFWLCYCFYYVTINNGNWLFVLIYVLLVNHRPNVITPFHYFMLSLAFTERSIEVGSRFPIVHVLSASRKQWNPNEHAGNQSKIAAVRDR